MSEPSLNVSFVGDAELHAYLDGELTAQALPQIEARLLLEVNARILMKSLKIQRNALQKKYPLPDDCPKTKAMINAVLGKLT